MFIEAETVLAMCLLTVGTSSTAFGQETTSDEARLGVGMFATLGTPNAAFGGGGAAVIFDLRNFRIAGRIAVGIDDEGTDELAVGGRILFALHRAKMADFSLGAGLAVGNVFVDGPGDNTYILVEGLGQIRVFLVDNVALSGSLGVALAMGESRVLFGLGGQLTGGFGFSYYF